MNILIGCDPEFFVHKRGRPVSAFGLVNGTKVAPTPVKDGAVQVDGLALEFNIKPAANSDEFIHNINSVLSELRAMVPKEYKFKYDSVAFFSKKHMDEQPEEAKALGCTPDFDAYSGEENIPPDGSGLMRTAAGHVHIGWTQGAEPFDMEHYEMCRNISRNLDVSLGVPSVIMDDGDQRREMYGKAGCFRPKVYGVEYRVLSNFWLKSPNLMKWVYDTTVGTVNNALSGNSFSRDHILAAKEVIDNNDKKMAKKLIKELKLSVL